MKYKKGTILDAIVSVTWEPYAVVYDITSSKYVMSYFVMTSIDGERRFYDIKLFWNEYYENEVILVTDVFC